MLFKSFKTAPIALLAALSISLTSLSATPVRADRDTARIIAGVAAVAIIGAAIADSRNDKRKVTRYHNNRFHNPYYYQPRKVYRHHHNRGHFHGHSQRKFKHKHFHHKHKFKKSHNRW